MADGVAITAGAGTTIATDDCGAGGHVQIIKLAISTDGSVTLIGADATNGLDVDVTRVIPGTSATHLGKAEDAGHSTGDVGVMMLGVRNDADASLVSNDLDYIPIATSPAGKVLSLAQRDLVRIAVDSDGLTTATTSYSAGDQVGTQFTLTGAARVSGGTGTIVAVTLTDAADIIGAYDVVFTRSSITLAGDNAAWAVSDTDAKAIVGLAQLAGAFDLTNNRICQLYSLAIPYDCSGGTSLYASLITRSAHTFFAAVTNLQLCVWVERN